MRSLTAFEIIFHFQTLTKQSLELYYGLLHYYDNIMVFVPSCSLTNIAKFFQNLWSEVLLPIDVRHCFLKKNVLPKKGCKDQHLPLPVDNHFLS